MIKQIRNTLLAGVMAVSLVSVSAPGRAGSDYSWVGTAVGSAGTLYSTVKTIMNGNAVWMIISNIDPAQVALEYMVLRELKKLNVEWDPEPKDSYEKSAQDNGGSCGGGSSGGDTDTSPDTSNVTKAGSLSFQVAVLKNVGIEAIGIGADLSSLVSDSTRSAILSGLAFLKKTDGSSSDDENDTGGAGSCKASYSVCLNATTATEQEEVRKTQVKNEQYFGTAGVARAELGLKTVQQAIVENGGTAPASSSKSTVQNLTGLVGKGSNTAAAQKIVALMNLELAQRLNVGNMLQGSTLTVEAAYAFTKLSTLTD